MAAKKWKIALTNNILSLWVRFFGAKKPLDEPINTIEFDHIAVFSTTALGDFMLNTPAIRALRKRYPKASITLLSSHKNRTLVESCAYFAKVIYWDQKVHYLPSVVHQLRREKPQLAVLLHSKHPYDIAATVLSGCQCILKDSYQTEPIGMEDWLAGETSNRFDGHQIARKLSLVAKLGCDITDVTMFLPCSYTFLPAVENQIIIGFQMGASKPDRMWPVTCFIELAHILFSKDNAYRIVLIGTAQETSLGEALLAELNDTEKQRIDNVIGKTDLPELLAQIKRFSVLVTGDTGPLHLAVSLKTPTVSLFGGFANPKYTGPYQDPHLHTVIQAPLTDDLRKGDLSAVSAELVAQKIFVQTQAKISESSQKTAGAG